MKKILSIYGAIIITSLILSSCSSSLPDNFCGKYYERDLSGNKQKDYIALNKDGSWFWIGENKVKLAYGKYSVSHLGEWAFGPDSWEINFNIEGGKFSSYFDDSQVVYYHDINKATGERNYYRINGLMPETGAGTNFYKK